MSRKRQKNAADRIQVADDRRAEKVLEELRKECTQSVLSTPNGRWFVADLLDRAHIHETSYSDSPHYTYYLEGERNFGLLIQAQAIAADHEAYQLMDREMKTYKERRDALAEALRQQAGNESAVID